MLVCFVGPPISGKTTTAARLFAELKDLGYPAEFVPERARWYIAHKQNGLGEGQKLELHDTDQQVILLDQADAERLMNRRGSIVVTDSSVLNTPIYMTDEGRVQEFVLNQVAQGLLRYDVIFRCPPVPSSLVEDPNRIHTIAQSRILDAKLDLVLAEHAVKTHLLSGTSQARARKAMDVVLEKLVS